MGTGGRKYLHCGRIIVVIVMSMGVHQQVQAIALQFSKDILIDTGGWIDEDGFVRDFDNNR